MHRSQRGYLLIDRCYRDLVSPKGVVKNLNASDTRFRFSVTGYSRVNGYCSLPCALGKFSSRGECVTCPFGATECDSDGNPVVA